MKKLIIPLTLILTLTSCSTRKTVVPTTAVRDSVRTVIREKTVLVPDTVFVHIPLQKAERHTRDTVSTLQNDYALSTARVTADGLLHHTLTTKPQPIATPIQKPVTEISDTRTVTRTVTQTVTVPRPYTWWDRLRFIYFYTSIICVLIVQSPLIYRYLRRKLAR